MVTTSNLIPSSLFSLTETRNSLMRDCSNDGETYVLVSDALYSLYWKTMSIITCDVFCGKPGGIVKKFSWTSLNWTDLSPKGMLRWQILLWALSWFSNSWMDWWRKNAWQRVYMSILITNFSYANSSTWQTIFICRRS